MIEIRYLGSLREKIGKKNECIFARSISDVLKYIKKTYSKDIYLLTRSMIITVNGSDIRLLKGMKTELLDNYVVSFYPPAAGG